MRYKVTIKIEGYWGIRYWEKLIVAADEEEAEEKADQYLDRIETRYDEENGTYEEATIEDITPIGERTLEGWDKVEA